MRKRLSSCLRFQLLVFLFIGCAAPRTESASEWLLRKTSDAYVSLTGQKIEHFVFDLKLKELKKTDFLEPEWDELRKILSAEEMKKIQKKTFNVYATIDYSKDRENSLPGKAWEIRLKGMPTDDRQRVKEILKGIEAILYFKFKSMVNFLDICYVEGVRIPNAFSDFSASRRVASESASIELRKKIDDENVQIVHFLFSHAKLLKIENYVGDNGFSHEFKFESTGGKFLVKEVVESHSRFDAVYSYKFLFKEIDKKLIPSSISETIKGQAIRTYNFENFRLRP